MAAHIAIYVFDGLTALDAVGPYDVLNRLPPRKSCSSGMDGARSAQSVAPG